MKYCPNCGSAVEEGARFCGVCGTNLSSGAKPPEPPKKFPVWLGIVIAVLVLGVLGASDDQIKMDYLLTSWAGFINGNEYPAWFNELVRSFDRYEGATLSARICTFFKTVLGFTEGDLDEIRAIMLEDPA